MRANEKRYLREFIPAMTLYVIIMLAVWPLSKGTASPVWKIVLALLPMLPIALVLRAIVRNIRDSDEFQRRLQLEALAIACVIVSAASMSAGFLVAARVFDLDGSILLWVFPSLAGLFGLVRALVGRHYRSP